MMNKKVLLVDDDEMVLSGYKRILRDRFTIFTANGGKAGLEIIEQKGPFAAVVSDFKMPEMNGNQFLSKVKEIAPDTVRMMLTGYADINTAIEAVNQGNIFRLLSKPCTTEKLTASLNDALKQYGLITSERELLEKTLKGTIKILSDIQSSVNPIAFSRTSRIQKFIPKIAKLLNIEDYWELEMSVMLSQIGCVIVPPEILEKKYAGEKLSEEMENLYRSHPKVGKQLLENIPRLEKVATAIYHQFDNYSDPDNPDKLQGESLPLTSRILKVLNDFDTYVTAGYTFEDAFKKLKNNRIAYDPRVVVALDVAIAGIYEGLTLLSVYVKDLTPGVVVAADIVDENGFVLITKGAEITEMLKMKLMNYSNLGKVREPIQILK